MLSASNRLSMLASRISKQFSTQKTINNIELHSNGSLIKLILNRPKALNSLSTQMVIDIGSQIDCFNEHKAFWIEGAGGKSFCAGGDVKALFIDGANVDDRINFFKK